MLVDERGRTVPKVLDFGIAKVSEGPVSPTSGRTLTESVVVAFSPGYASPEQVSRGRTGPWTDVHALALILVEVLTDRHAYPQDDISKIGSEILSEHRPTPRALGVEVGPWELILRRALAVNAAERHPDAGALLADLTTSVDAAEAAFAPGHRATAVGDTLPAADAPASPHPGSSARAVPAQSSRTTSPAASDAVRIASSPGAPSAVRYGALGAALVGVLAGTLYLLREQPASRVEPPASPPAAAVAAAAPYPALVPLGAPAAPRVPLDADAGARAATAPRSGPLPLPKPAAPGGVPRPRRSPNRLAPTQTFE